jgi:hypothetical protein
VFAATTGSSNKVGIDSVSKNYKTKIEGHQIIPIPEYLELKFILFKCCFCFRSAKFKHYMETMDEVGEDLQTHMDLITFMRRIRMHGFALTVMLNKTYRIFTASRSKRKALESITIKTNNKNWNKYEDLSYRERIEAGIFKRFMDVTEHAKDVKFKKRMTRLDGLVKGGIEYRMRRMSELHPDFSLEL